VSTEPLSASDPLAASDFGRPVRGPSALIDDPARMWHLTYNIARNDWKLRFFGSALGYVWQLVRPLLLFGVLYVFFTKVAHVDKQGGQANARYGTQLLGSIILFTFFSEATIGAVRSVVDRETLVRKIQFPRMVIPLSVVLLAMFNLGLNLVVVFVFGLVEGVRPMWTWLELPVILFVLIIFSTGVAMLLSALFVSMRDIQPIWDVVNQVLFYASPVIISVTTIQSRVSHSLFHLYMFNPLAVCFQEFRHAIVNNASPSAGTLLGGWEYIVSPLAIVAGVFALGFWVFNRTAPLVAENL
jgi:ABC-2 type transport system permease protein